MKKDRIGYSIQVILPLSKKEYFREIWFNYSSTIGIRERIQSRYTLLRRNGQCTTKFGKIKLKQTLQPDGEVRWKPENDEILRLSLEHNKTTEEIRNIIKDSSREFENLENWK